MILEITAAAIGGGFVGFGVCAFLTMGKLTEANETFERIDDLHMTAWLEMHAAHARCADALTTKQSRIDRALTQVTPGANATVLRIARILRGEA